VCAVVTPSFDSDDDEITHTMACSVNEAVHGGATDATAWPDDTVPLDEPPGTVLDVHRHSGRR